MQLNRQVIGGIALSFALWYIVFLTEFLWSFWFRVTLASILLAFYAKVTGTQKVTLPELNETVKGLVAGAILYIAFYVGFNVFRSLLLTGAVNVYTFRDELPLLVPTMLLLATSFCEEYFWRHYIQASIVDSIGVKGIIVTSILYAGIHISTLNLPLIAAALIAGTFWGFIYDHYKSLWMVVFSHLVWTELIFVFMPLAQ